MQNDWSRLLKRKIRRRICWGMFIQRLLISNCRFWPIGKLGTFLRSPLKLLRWRDFTFSSQELLFTRNIYKEGLIKDLLRTVELFHLLYLVKSEYSFWDLFWNTRGAEKSETQLPYFCLEKTNRTLKRLFLPMRNPFHHVTENLCFCCSNK